MQITVENSDYAVEYTAVNMDVAVSPQAEINVAVGDAARIDVGEALNYIKTGQAEVQEVVDSGTAAFNLNASQKTIAFNNNASGKTTDFNDNATAKTGDFNTNATNKTNAFNQNATDKTDAFNLNAGNKTTDFNDNYTAKKALIDAEVATASGYAANAKQWAIGDPSEPVGNSAKYWAEQAQTTLSTKANVDLSNLSATGEAKFVKLVTTGSSNGTIKVDGTDVSVYGLGSAAYTASTAYATAAQGGLADTAVQPADLTNYVTTNTDQDITGIKTFVGAKRIKFKQSSVGNKLGFTLYNNNNKEAASFEYITSAIDGYPLMYLGQYIGSNSVSYVTTPVYVGFRYYDYYSQAAYQLVAPLAKDAKTPFNLDIYHKTFYLPLGVTDGNTTVTTPSTGLLDISSLLPTIPTVDQTYDATSANAQSGVAVASAISGKADDNAVVHIAGTETITGDKTFTGSLIIPSNTTIAKQDNNLEGGQIVFQRANNDPLAQHPVIDLYNGDMRFLYANSVKVITPATSSNDTTAATTAFVKNVLSELYPVGSIYIGTQATCPLATLISGSTWTLVSKGRVLQGVDTGQTAGSTVAAGLPNIQAHFNYTVANTSPSGATYNDYDANGQVGNIAGTGYETVFDASRSNSIYGNSTTVQPPAYLVNIWERTA